MRDLADGKIKPYWAFSDINTQSRMALLSWGLIEQKPNGYKMNYPTCPGDLNPLYNHYQIRLTKRGIAMRSNCFDIAARLKNGQRRNTFKRLCVSVVCYDERGGKMRKNLSKIGGVVEFEGLYFEYLDECNGI